MYHQYTLPLNGRIPLVFVSCALLSTITEKESLTEVSVFVGLFVTVNKPLRPGCVSCIIITRTCISPGHGTALNACKVLRGENQK